MADGKQQVSFQPYGPVSTCEHIILFMLVLHKHIYARWILRVIIRLACYVHLVALNKGFAGLYERDIWLLGHSCLEHW